MPDRGRGEATNDLEALSPPPRHSDVEEEGDLSPAAAEEEMGKLEEEFAELTMSIEGDTSELVTSSAPNPSLSSSSSASLPPATTEEEKKANLLRFLESLQPTQERAGLKAAGSEEKRLAARRAIYNTGVRRLDAFFRKADLVEALKAVGLLYSKAMERLRKQELLELIVTEHWEIDNPDAEKKSRVELRRMQSIRTTARLHQAKRYDIPSFPLTQGLFSHIGQLMRSSIVVAPSEDSTVVTVTYAGLKAYRDQLDRLVWLALQRDYATSKRKLLTSSAGLASPDVLGDCAYFPFATRHELPWYFARPAFVSRLRCVRPNPLLPAAAPFTSSRHSSAHFLRPAILNALGGNRREGVTVQATFGHFLRSHQNVQELHPPRHLTSFFNPLPRPQFLSDAPLPALRPSRPDEPFPISLQSDERREVIYRATRLQRAEAVEILSTTKLLRLVWQDEAGAGARGSWKASIKHSLAEVDVMFPALSMDVRLAVTTEDAIDLTTADWLSAFTARTPSIPLKLTSTTLDGAEEHWYLERDATTRRSTLYSDDISTRLITRELVRTFDAKARSTALIVRSAQTGVNERTIEDMLSYVEQAATIEESVMTPPLTLRESVEVTEEGEEEGEEL